MSSGRPARRASDAGLVYVHSMCKFHAWCVQSLLSDVCVPLLSIGNAQTSEADE